MDSQKAGTRKGPGLFASLVGKVQFHAWDLSRISSSHTFPVGMVPAIKGNLSQKNQ